MELPHDLIIYDIVTRLPIKTILQFKSVSKQWYSSISSSNFGNAHFNISPSFYPDSHINCVFIHSKSNNCFLYSLDDEEDDDDDHATFEKGLLKLDDDYDILQKDDEINLIGSCNGLICLHSILGNYLIIWNPIIHQWHKFSYPFLQGFQNFTWGFGYVSSNGDYKIVRISESEENRVIFVHVFSLKTQKWKQIHNNNLHGFTFNGRPNLGGVLVSETLYWIMYKRGHGEKQGILGFDLIHENFNEIRGIIPSDTYLSNFRFLGCLGRFLAMGRVTNSGDVSVSMLDKNGQMKYLGLYRDMNLSSCSNVVGFTEAGKFFIQLGDQELGLVNSIHSSPKEYTRLVTFNEQGSSIRALRYTPSLIYPSAVAEMHKE